MSSTKVVQLFPGGEPEANQQLSIPNLPQHSGRQLTEAEKADILEKIEMIDMELELKRRDCADLEDTLLEKPLPEAPKEEKEHWKRVLNRFVLMIQVEKCRNIQGIQVLLLKLI